VRNLMLILIALSSGWLSGGDEDPFAPIRFLVGSWSGKGNGPGGSSTVTHTFEPLLAEKFIRWSTRSIFAPRPDGSSDSHEDIGFFSYDGERKKIVLRQFLSEGYVNTYLLDEGATDKKLVFTTESSENAGGTRARLSFAIIEPGQYKSELALAPPGKEFVVCQDQDMGKLDPANWLRGLDVSHFSGPVDWEKIKNEGHRFAVAKATEGDDWLDPTFNDNIEAIKKAGLIRGAYHFFVAHDDPEPQAENFIKNVSLTSGDLPPVIDIETLSNRPVTDLADRLNKWLQIVEKHYGVKPIIYTSHNFWNQQLQQSFGDYPLWIAEYTEDLPQVPNGWLVWSFWQYDGDAIPPGVTKMADLNYFNGTLEELKGLLIP